MPNSLVIAIIGGLGGMLGWGFSEFATKKSVDIVGAISSLVWAHIFGSVLLFSLLFSKLLVSPSILPNSPPQKVTNKRKRETETH